MSEFNQVQFSTGTYILSRFSLRLQGFLGTKGIKHLGKWNVNDSFFEKYI